MNRSPLLSLALALGVSVSVTGCASWFHRFDSEAQSAHAAEPIPPSPLPATQGVKLPTPTRIKLSNGLTLLVVERHNLPIISVSTVVRAGDSYDPSDKAGLASLTADLLRRGTTKRTAPEIAEAIDFVGGSLDTSSGLDSTTVSVSVLKKDLGLGLELLSGVLTHPTFPPSELGKLKEEESAGLRSALDDANEVVRMAFGRSVLRGHPYGLATTLTSLKAISRSDVLAFYNAYYHPNNAFMAVVGDITPDEARTRIEAALAGWKPAPVKKSSLPPPAPTGKRTIEVVDMPVNQSFIRLGNVAVKRNTPDFFPLQVMNFILGGDFTSRLNESIRDKQGLAYGAGSGLGMNLWGGTFVASLNTKTESTGQALRSLLAELKRIQDEPVTDQELAFAKDYLTGSFPLRFETNSDLAREVVNIEFFGLPEDYLATYRDRVRAVTKEDIARVARKYLPAENYNLVVVGKASAIQKDLAPYGPTTAVDKLSLIR